MLGVTLGKYHPRDLNVVGAIAMTDSVGTKVERKAKRRWWQFSLASLLLLMTVLALFLGFWADSARRQKRTVQWIGERGGTMFYGYEDPYSAAKADPPGPTWLREWLGIDYLDYVQFVSIENESVTDADLATLCKDLPRLSFLAVERPEYLRCRNRPLGIVAGTEKLAS